MGPILIFDKSTLHALSVDECVWLGRFYNVNITPIYFAEVIADLEKEVAEGRRPEDIVARLAVKTTALESRANVHHVKMCTADLMGNAIDMHGVPVLEGGRPVAQKGKKGLVFSIPPETKMLDRWRSSRFAGACRSVGMADTAVVWVAVPGQHRLTHVGGDGRRPLTSCSAISPECLISAFWAPFHLDAAIEPHIRRMTCGEYIAVCGESLV